MTVALLLPAPSLPNTFIHKLFLARVDIVICQRPRAHLASFQQAPKNLIDRCGSLMNMKHQILFVPRGPVALSKAGSPICYAEDLPPLMNIRQAQIAILI